MRLIITIKFIFFSCPLLVFAQFNLTDIYKDNLKFRDSVNLRFSLQEHSPLPLHIMDEFESLPFFEIDSTYRIEANFRELKYDEDNKDAVASINFLINNDSVRLLLYRYSDTENLLYLPFTDRTTDYETHIRGRYLIIERSKEERIFIDFNKSMNTDCAYTHDPPCGWSPRQNHINYPIRAGAKFFQDPNWKKLDKEPKYNKGNGFFYSDLFAKVKFPDHLDRSKINFPISVKAIVNANGSISDPVILYGFHEDLDKLILKAFTKMKKGSFEPGELNGKKVRKYLTFVIDPKHFKN